MKIYAETSGVASISVDKNATAAAAAAVALPLLLSVVCAVYFYEATVTLEVAIAPGHKTRKKQGKIDLVINFFWIFF